MKILIIHTARSKSTALHDWLSEYYSLTPLRNLITYSRIQNQNTSEYEELLNRINTEDNICVKVCCQDWIDLPRKTLVELHKKLAWHTFDRVILCTRNNAIDAVCSYAKMNPFDRQSWHRRAGQDVDYSQYTVPVEKIFYLMRGYTVYKWINEFVDANIDPQRVCRFEYEQLEQQLVEQLGIDPADVAIDIIPNLYDYKNLVTNYSDVASLTPKVLHKLQQFSWDTVNPDCAFWDSKMPD